MANRWKEVWNRRQIDLDKLNETDEFSIYKELKRLDGFDVQVENENGYYKSFHEGILEIYDKKLKSYKSVYEIGCGSGANLFVFHKRGMIVGGVDYSEQLIGVAQKKLPGCDIDVDEAIRIDTEKQYDVVISDSVFAYFQDIEYAEQVLEKMYLKARYEVILLEIFDKDLEDKCQAYRRSQMEDYDKKYEGLDKLFYPKQMFADFAEKHDCKIEFRSIKNDYYWNSKFMYNCFIMKNSICSEPPRVQ